MDRLETCVWGGDEPKLFYIVWLTETILYSSVDGAFNGRNVPLMAECKSLVIDTQNLLESNLGYEYMKRGLMKKMNKA